MRVLNTLLFCLLISGCSVLSSKPTEPEPIVKTVSVVTPLEIYQPPLPNEISLEDVQFFIITENNLEEKIAEIEAMQGASFVIFGMTPHAYENMAYNLQEIRRFIRQQKEIILYYRVATTGDEDGKTTFEDWIEKNNQLVSDQTK